jgi:hypothetical protein
LLNFGLKIVIVGTEKFEGRTRELVENLPDLALLIFSCPTFPNLLQCMSPLMADVVDKLADEGRVDLYQCL